MYGAAFLAAYRVASPVAFLVACQPRLPRREPAVAQQLRPERARQRRPRQRRVRRLQLLRVDARLDRPGRAVRVDGAADAAARP